MPEIGRAGWGSGVARIWKQRGHLRGQVRGGMTLPTKETVQTGLGPFPPNFCHFCM